MKRIFLAGRGTRPGSRLAPSASAVSSDLASNDIAPAMPSSTSGQPQLIMLPSVETVPGLQVAGRRLPAGPTGAVEAARKCDGPGRTTLQVRAQAIQVAARLLAPGTDVEQSRAGPSRQRAT